MSRRSLSFQRYVESLPLEEQAKIRQAERDYLESTRSRNAALDRDFTEALTGVAAPAPPEVAE